MNSATSATTIVALREMFARFGIPDQIVSDNGSQFASDEFQKFMKMNGIKHIFSAPYHPSTNGLAERFVQTFKLAMKSSNATESTVNECLQRFLIAYRNASHGTTQSSPASVLLGRPLRTRIDLINPMSKSEQNVLRSQTKQVEYHMPRKSPATYIDGDIVVARDYRHNTDDWQPGTIVSKTGPVSYRVELDDGSIWRRHADQLKGHKHPVEECTPLPTDTIETAVSSPVSTRESVPPTSSEEPSPAMNAPTRHSNRPSKAPERLIESI